VPDFQEGGHLAAPIDPFIDGGVAVVVLRRAD
jgi:hypothetical protein